MPGLVDFSVFDEIDKNIVDDFTGETFTSENFILTLQQLNQLKYHQRHGHSLVCSVPQIMLYAYNCIPRETLKKILRR